MPTHEIPKEWAAIQDQKKLLTRETKPEVRQALREYDVDESAVEIVALPKTHTSIFV